MQKKFWIFVSVVAVLALLLAACGGGKQESAEPMEAGSSEQGGAAEAGMAGDPAAGKAIFEQSVIGSNPGCATCHSRDAGVTLVGPSLAGIATTAASRVDGMSAEEYIRQSILEPEAYVVDGFVAGTMVPGWDKALSEKELNDLVAYLMTLQ
ncbi:MAG: cytochrome c [Anaerolineae bacterium]|nr:MAG: cytochrome c [Anaerolineae bacterium]